MDKKGSLHYNKAKIFADIRIKRENVYCAATERLRLWWKKKTESGYNHRTDWHECSDFCCADDVGKNGRYILYIGAWSDV